jgi:hypothetical protein
VLIALRVAGLALLAVGLVILVYGGFSFTEEKHEAKLGPIEIQVRDEDRVEVPKWAGIAAVVAGVGLLASSVGRHG